MSRSNTVTTENGNIIFKYNNKIYSTIHANNVHYTVFSESIKALKNIDINGKLKVTGKVDFIDRVVLKSNINTNNLYSGALIVDGGTAIKKNLFVGGKTHITDTSDYINNNAALVVDGGVIIKKRLCMKSNHIDMNNNKIINLKSPQGNNDAVNKKYVDDSILNAGRSDVYIVDNISSMNNLTPLKGDIVKITNNNTSHVYDGNVWIELQTISLISSVNNKTGDVILSTSDIGEGSNLYYTENRVSTNIDVAANTLHRNNINNPHNITKEQLGLNNVENIKTNLNATAAPSVTDDIDSDYDVGSLWCDVNNHNIYMCTDPAVGSANWYHFTNNSTYTQLDSHVTSNAAHGTTSAIVGISDLQTLSNKMLIDTNTAIVNKDNTSKRVMFSLNGADPNSITLLNFIHTGNKIITFPDTSDTLVTTSYTQTLTNKKLDHVSNEIVANKLRSYNGTAMVINTPTAPSPGQVLTATSATSAEWLLNSSGTGNGINTVVIPFINMQVKVFNTSYTTIAYFPWLDSRHKNYRNGVVIFRTGIIDRNLHIRLINM